MKFSFNAILIAVIAAQTPTPDDRNDFGNYMAEWGKNYKTTSEYNFRLA